MFKNKPDSPLGPEIVATTPNGTPTATKIRMGMKSSSICTKKPAKGAGKKTKKDQGAQRPRANTQYAARRVMIVIARLLDVAAHVLGESLNPRSLLAALLRIDSLNAADRLEVIEALGADVDVLRSYISDEMLKVLNSTSRDPWLLAVHLRKILRGPVGLACWGKDVTENQMTNAVASNLDQMALGLLQGPKATKGIVAWGPAGETNNGAESAKPPKSPMQPSPTLSRSRRQTSEETSIWATLKEPEVVPGAPSKKRAFVVGRTTVRFL
jgi:hypothetical protein